MLIYDPYQVLCTVHNCVLYIYETGTVHLYQHHPQHISSADIVI
jgi:hypothetical protein